MSFSSDVFKVALYLLGCVFTLKFMIWQNHNYAVDPASLPEGVEVTHVNLNDGSCAGLAYPALNIMSLQYHPEASPGPHDSDCGKNFFPTSNLDKLILVFYF